MVLWSRAAIQIRSTHENGPKGAPGMDTEIPKEGACRCSCGSCARPNPANCNGTRVGDFIGESRTRPRPCVCFVPCAPGHQYDCPVAEGYQLSGTPSGVCASAEDVLGQALLGSGLPSGHVGHITDEMVQEYIGGQEGEPIHDDSQFPIDNS